MEYSTSTRSRKSKGWEEECKKVIYELSQSLTAAKYENEKMKERMEEMEKIIGACTSREKELKEKIILYEDQLKKRQVTQTERQSEHHASNQSHKREVEANLKKLEQSQKCNDELRTTIIKKQTEIEELEKKLKKTKNQLNEAHIHINFLKNEVQTLRFRINDHEQQYLEENEKLKDLNKDIKQQFNFIQKEYDAALRDSKDSSFILSPLPYQKNTLSSDKMQFYVSREYREGETRKIQETRSVNPEMGGELRKIKKEIASQYSRLNETRQTVLKQRVSKTLSNIQIILTDISTRFQDETSSYE